MRKKYKLIIEVSDKILLNSEQETVLETIIFKLNQLGIKIIQIQQENNKNTQS